MTAAAILVFALLVAVAGGLNTRNAVKASFDEQTAIERGQLALEHMLRVQLDEQNFIRAFVITHDPSYIDSYRVTSAEFYTTRAQLQAVLAREGLLDAQNALVEYEAAHRDWQNQVAKPLLEHPHFGAREIEKSGKSLIELQTQAAQFIEARMDTRDTQLLATTQQRIDISTAAGTGALVIFGLLAILFYGWRNRVNAALESERVTTQTLQRAFRSEHVPLPNCRIGSAYGAASTRLAVGGDVFDVHRLSDRLGLILIADVSGKGVDAAVLTAFIKFTIRGIALRRRDPGYVLQEFNRAFPATVGDPNIFVSMFVGFIDTWSLRLDYASAGHDVAFIRHPGEVEQLSVTGPVLGVMEEPFEVRTAYLEHGDTIVLSTDGLTESRDPEGEMLENAGAMNWIAEGPQDPTELAEYLIERARVRSGDRMRDDVAVLAIRIDRPSRVTLLPKREGKSRV